MTREEFQTLAADLRPRLVAQATRLLADGDAAEDAVQDTLLKLWTMRDGLSDYRSPASLASVICRNLCLDRMKRPSVKSTTSIDLDEAREIVSNAPSPLQRLSDREMLDEALRIMRTLPDSVQTVMEMRHVEGMETEEIARLIGSTVQSVRVNLSRGRRRLKELFDNRQI